MERYLSAGIARVILGAMAVEKPERMESLAANYPGAIAMGVDARNGFVAIHGWRTLTDIPAAGLLQGLPGRGVSWAVYTDISTDGPPGATATNA